MSGKGKSKFLISVDDSTTSAKMVAKGLRNVIRDEHRGDMLVCEDNNGHIPEEFFTALTKAASEEEKVYVLVFKGTKASVACRNFINSDHLNNNPAHRKSLVGLVSDYNMPHYNGAELISMIREKGYNEEEVYIVGVSAEETGKEDVSGVKVLSSFRESGAQEAYIKKDFKDDISHVWNAVYNMLGQNDKYIKPAEELNNDIGRVRSTSSGEGTISQKEGYLDHVTPATEHTGDERLKMKRSFGSGNSNTVRVVVDSEDASSCVIGVTSDRKIEHKQCCAIS